MVMKTFGQSGETYLGGACFSIINQSRDLQPGASLAFLAAFEVEDVVLVPAMFVVSAQGAIRSQTAR
jgi:hypothetical protein